MMTMMMVLFCFPAAAEVDMPLDLVYIIERK